MKTRSWMMAATLAFSAVGVAGYKIGRARADGAPTMQPLYYSGVLDDGGRPVEGARSITVRLFDAAMGGTAVCTTISPTAQVSGGRFRVALDAACAGAVQANPDLWAEVIVDAVTFPRQKLGAVPYALEAGRAAGASGALERRIAALESSARPRQLVVGPPPLVYSATFSSGASQSCSRTFTPLSHIPSITFTADRNSRYRVSAYLSSNYGINEARIGSPTSQTYLLRNIAMATYSPATISSPVGAIVSLVQGQTYTFHVEVRLTDSMTTSCTVGPRFSDSGSGPNDTRYAPASTAIVVEQLD